MISLVDNRDQAVGKSGIHFQLNFSCFCLDLLNLASYIEFFFDKAILTQFDWKYVRCRAMIHAFSRRIAMIHK